MNLTGHLGSILGAILPAGFQMTPDPSASFPNGFHVCYGWRGNHKPVFIPLSYDVCGFCTFRQPLDLRDITAEVMAVARYFGRAIVFEAGRPIIPSDISQYLECPFPKDDDL